MTLQTHKSSSSQVNYGVSFERIQEKIDYVITALPLCVFMNLVITASTNGLLPIQHQTIIWTIWIG